MLATSRSDWTPAELDAIGSAEELQISSRREDGTLRPYVTIWVVRAAAELYVRSARGPDAAWFRRAKAGGVGRVRAGGAEFDVSFAEPAPDVHPSVDAAYHAKYDRYGPAIVNSVVGPKSAAVTIRLVRRSSG